MKKTAVLLLMIFALCACEPTGKKHQPVGNPTPQPTEKTPEKDPKKRSCALKLSVNELKTLKTQADLHFANLANGQFNLNCNDSNRTKFLAAGGGAMGLAIKTNFPHLEEQLSVDYLNFLASFLDEKNCRIRNFSEQELEELSSCNWINQ